MYRLIVIACLLALSLVGFTACDEDEASNPDTSTPGATSAATQPVPTSDTGGTAEPTAIVAIGTTENTVAFGRDPVTGPATTTDQVQLILADGGTPDVGPGAPPIDRMAFQFPSGLPGYQIQYVQAPVQQCASGATEQITGQAFLEVRLEPAAAHDDQGSQTVSPTDLQPGLPVLQQAKQTCDFEGVVVWTLGLAAEVDFRVNTFGDQILIIDLKHP